MSFWPTNMHTNMQGRVLEKKNKKLFSWLKRERFSRIMPFVLPLCLLGMQLPGWSSNSLLWAQRRELHFKDGEAETRSRGPSCQPRRAFLCNINLCERKTLNCFSLYSQGSVKCNHSPFLTKLCIQCNINPKLAVRKMCRWKCYNFS